MKLTAPRPDGRPAPAEAGSESHLAHPTVPAAVAITIFAGRFGSGKTEVAINYALAQVQGRNREAGNWQQDERTTSNAWGEHVRKGHIPEGHRQTIHPPASERVILIDLDIVTPYFRSRETAEVMQDRGVEVIAPSVIGQHLDTPAITPQILGAIEQPDRPVVLDVGGDQQGARALGQFSAAIRQRGYTMYFVVNPYRPFTDTLDGLTRSIAEIEASARLQVTSLVSNPNLIGETTARHVTEGHARIAAFARGLSLPIAFVCVERRWVREFDSHEPVLTLDRYFTMSWE